MQSLKTQNVGRPVSSVESLFTNDGSRDPSLGSLNDPKLLLQHWFSNNEDQLRHCTREYTSKLMKWRNCKNEKVVSFLKGYLKRIMQNLQVQSVYMNQKLLVCSNDDLVQLVSLYLDLELRAWPSLCAKRGVSAVAEKRLTDRLIHWLYTVLTTTDMRVDALLNLVMVYATTSKSLLDPIFRKVLDELISGPLSGVEYIRTILFYKLWNEKVRIGEDDEVRKIRNKLLPNLKTARPYQQMPNVLRMCMPYVSKDERDVTQFLLNSNIYLKKACTDFLQCRTLDLPDVIDIDNIDIDVGVKHLNLEEDETEDLINMFKNLKEKNNVEVIDLTDEDVSIVSVSNPRVPQVIDLTEDEEKASASFSNKSGISSPEPEYKTESGYTSLCPVSSTSRTDYYEENKTYRRIHTERDKTILTQAEEDEINNLFSGGVNCVNYCAIERTLNDNSTSVTNSDNSMCKNRTSTSDNTNLRDRQLNETRNQQKKLDTRNKSPVYLQTVHNFFDETTQMNDISLNNSSNTSVDSLTTSNITSSAFQVGLHKNKQIIKNSIPGTSNTNQDVTEAIPNTTFNKHTLSQQEKTNSTTHFTFTNDEKQTQKSIITPDKFNRKFQFPKNGIVEDKRNRSRFNQEFVSNNEKMKIIASLVKEPTKNTSSQNGGSSPITHRNILKNIDEDLANKLEDILRKEEDIINRGVDDLNISKIILNRNRTIVKINEDIMNKKEESTQKTVDDISKNILNRNRNILKINENIDKKQESTRRGVDDLKISINIPKNNEDILNKKDESTRNKTTDDTITENNERPESNSIENRDNFTRNEDNSSRNKDDSGTNQEQIILNNEVGKTLDRRKSVEDNVLDRRKIEDNTDLSKVDGTHKISKNITSSEENTITEDKINDITSRTEDLLVITNQDVCTNTEDVVRTNENDCTNTENIDRTNEDICLNKEDINVTNETNEDITRRNEIITNKNEDNSRTQENVIDKNEDLIKRNEDITRENESITNENESSCRKSENVSDKNENISNKNEDTVTKDDEDIDERNEIITNKNEELISKNDNFSIFRNENQQKLLSNKTITNEPINDEKFKNSFKPSDSKTFVMKSFSNYNMYDYRDVFDASSSDEDYSYRNVEDYVIVQTVDPNENTFSSQDSEKQSNESIETYFNIPEEPNKNPYLPPDISTSDNNQTFEQLLDEVAAASDIIPPKKDNEKIENNFELKPVYVVCERMDFDKYFKEHQQNTKYNLRHAPKNPQPIKKRGRRRNTNLVKNDDTDKPKRKRGRPKVIKTPPIEEKRLEISSEDNSDDQSDDITTFTMITKYEDKPFRFSTDDFTVGKIGEKTNILISVPSNKEALKQKFTTNNENKITENTKSEDNIKLVENPTEDKICTNLKTDIRSSKEDTSSYSDENLKSKSSLEDDKSSLEDDKSSEENQKSTTKLPNDDIQLKEDIACKSLKEDNVIDSVSKNDITLLKSNENEKINTDAPLISEENNVSSQNSEDNHSITDDNHSISTVSINSEEAAPSINEHVPLVKIASKDDTLKENVDTVLSLIDNTHPIIVSNEKSEEINAPNLPSEIPNEDDRNHPIITPEEIIDDTPQKSSGKDTDASITPTEENIDDTKSSVFTPEEGEHILNIPKEEIVDVSKSVMFEPNSEIDSKENKKSSNDEIISEDNKEISSIVPFEKSDSEQILDASHDIDISIIESEEIVIAPEEIIEATPAEEIIDTTAEEIIDVAPIQDILDITQEIINIAPSEEILVSTSEEIIPCEEIPVVSSEEIIDESFEESEDILDIHDISIEENLNENIENTKISNKSDSYTNILDDLSEISSEENFDDFNDVTDREIKNNKSGEIIEKFEENLVTSDILSSEESLDTNTSLEIENSKPVVDIEKLINHEIFNYIDENCEIADEFVLDEPDTDVALKKIVETDLITESFQPNIETEVKFFNPKQYETQQANISIVPYEIQHPVYSSIEMSYEPTVFKMFYEIGHASQGIVKCSVNGVQKTKLPPKVYGESIIHEIPELNLIDMEDLPKYCKADEVYEPFVEIPKVLCEQPIVDDKYETRYSIPIIDPGTISDKDKNYNLNLLAYVTCNDCETNDMKCKKNKNDLSSPVTSPIPITISNTTHLQLSPEDYDFNGGFQFMPISPEIKTYQSETGYFTKNITPIEEPKYKPKNDFNDISNLANLDREIEEKKIEKKPEVVEKKPERTESKKKHVLGLINKFKKNETVRKAAEVKKQQSPYGYIRSTRPMRMVTRRNKTTEPPPKPPKLSMDQLFDQLLQANKLEKPTQPEEPKRNKYTLRSSGTVEEPEIFLHPTKTIEKCVKAMQKEEEIKPKKEIMKKIEIVPTKPEIVDVTPKPKTAKINDTETNFSLENIVNNLWTRKVKIKTGLEETLENCLKTEENDKSPKKKNKKEDIHDKEDKSEIIEKEENLKLEENKKIEELSKTDKRKSKDLPETHEDNSKLNEPNKNLEEKFNKRKSIVPKTNEDTTKLNNVNKEDVSKQNEDKPKLSEDKQKLGEIISKLTDNLKLNEIKTSVNKNIIENIGTTTKSDDENDEINLKTRSKINIIKMKNEINEKLKIDDVSNELGRRKSVDVKKSDVEEVEETEAVKNNKMKKSKAVKEPEQIEDVKPKRGRKPKNLDIKNIDDETEDVVALRLKRGRRSKSSCSNKSEDVEDMDTKWKKLVESESFQKIEVDDNAKKDDNPKIEQHIEELVDKKLRNKRSRKSQELNSKKDENEDIKKDDNVIEDNDDKKLRRGRSSVSSSSVSYTEEDDDDLDLETKYMRKSRKCKQVEAAVIETDKRTKRSRKITAKQIEEIPKVDVEIIEDKKSKDIETKNFETVKKIENVKKDIESEKLTEISNEPLKSENIKENQVENSKIIETVKTENIKKSKEIETEIPKMTETAKSKDVAKNKTETNEEKDIKSRKSKDNEAEKDIKEIKSKSGKFNVENIEVKNSKNIEPLTTEAEKSKDVKIEKSKPCEDIKATELDNIQKRKSDSEEIKLKNNEKTKNIEVAKSKEVEKIKNEAEFSNDSEAENLKYIDIRSKSKKEISKSKKKLNTDIIIIYNDKDKIKMDENCKILKTNTDDNEEKLDTISDKCDSNKITDNGNNKTSRRGRHKKNIVRILQTQESTVIIREMKMKKRKLTNSDEPVKSKRRKIDQVDETKSVTTKLEVKPETSGVKIEVTKKEIKPETDKKEIKTDVDVVKQSGVEIKTINKSEIKLDIKKKDLEVKSKVIGINQDSGTKKELVVIKKKSEGQKKESEANKNLLEVKKNKEVKVSEMKKRELEVKNELDVKKTETELKKKESECEAKKELDAKKKEMDLKKKELEAKNELDAKKKETELKKKELEAKNELDAKKKETELKKKELEVKKESDLKKKELETKKDSDVKKKELDTKKLSDVKKKESEMKKKESDTKTKPIETKKKDLETKKEELDAKKEPEVKKKEKETTNKEFEIKKKETEMKSKESEEKKKELEAKKKESELKKKESEIKKKEMELKKAELEVKSRESDVKKKEGDLKNKEVEIKKKEFEVKTKEFEIKKKEFDVKNKESEVKKKEFDVKNKESEVKKKESEMKKKECEMKKTKAELKEMPKSIENQSSSKILEPPMKKIKLDHSETLINEVVIELNDKEEEILKVPRTPSPTRRSSDDTIAPMQIETDIIEEIISEIPPTPSPTEKLDLIKENEAVSVETPNTSKPESLLVQIDLDKITLPKNFKKSTDNTERTLSVPTKGERKEYSECLLEINDDNIYPDPSYSPYSMESANIEFETVYNLAPDSIYDSFESYLKDYDLKEEQKDLQAGYSAPDTQFQYTFDEDLKFFNSCSDIFLGNNSMLSVNMNVIQPESKPHEIEEVDTANVIVNEIYNDLNQYTKVIENTEVIDDSKSVLIYSGEAITTTVMTQKIQPVYTTGPVKMISFENIESPSASFMNEEIPPENDKVVVQRIKDDKITPIVRMSPEPIIPERSHEVEKVEKKQRPVACIIPYIREDSNTTIKPIPTQSTVVKPTQPTAEELFDKMVNDDKLNKLNNPFNRNEHKKRKAPEEFHSPNKNPSSKNDYSWMNNPNIVSNLERFKRIKF